MIIVLIIKWNLHDSEPTGSASISLYLCWKFSSEGGSYYINDYWVRVKTTSMFGMVMLAIDGTPPP